MSSILLSIFGKDILDHIYQYDSTYKNKELINRLNREIFCTVWMKMLLNTVSGYGKRFHSEHITKILMQIQKGGIYDIIHNSVFPSNLINVEHFGKHLFMSYNEVNELARYINKTPETIDDWWVEYRVNFQDVTIFMTISKWYFIRIR